MLPPSTDANRFVTYTRCVLYTAYGLLYLLVNMCFHFDIRHELNFEYIFGAFFFLDLWRSMTLPRCWMEHLFG